MLHDTSSSLVILTSHFEATLHDTSFSLVILTSQFQPKRVLFWGGPRNFEPRSDDEDDTEDTKGRTFGLTYDLTCKRPNPRRIFSGIGFRTWNPSGPQKLRPYH
ncbi:hypothetical protein AVEN_91002-1 [Araneus ventricosus]|uniref:Uncharacterized protein n=1 Tax=Araneus ventricosus TaxID=182803 RepID=A0A4Y2MP93_ARAVE|nr:hypothetical protein AVEN_91002-1 [Araneus ventricosus]